MTITLTPEVARLLAEELKSGRYASADEVVLAGLKLLQQYETHVSENGDTARLSPSPIPDRLSNLAALAAELTKDVPASEWDKVPTDLAQNHDHYLYGAAKRD